MKKSIKKNYAINLLYEILSLLVPLVTTPYLSRTLGADGIGIYSYTHSNVYYFALLTALGTTVYGRREIAIYRDDKNRRSILFWELIIFRALMMIISTLLYLIYAINSKYQTIAFIQSIYIFSVFFDITWFFQGLEEFGKVVIRNSAVKILNIFLIFVFVEPNENGLLTYIIIMAALPTLGHILTWPFLIKYIEFIQISALHPLKHFKGAITLFVPTIASQVYLLLDKTMIGLFTSDNIENGFYEQAQKIIKISWTFLTVFSSVMSPRIANIFGKNNSDLITEYMKKSYKVMWMVSIPIAFGIASVSHILVPWFFGYEFYKVEALLYIFSSSVIAVGLSSVTGSQYLVSTRKQGVFTLSIIIGAGINFSLNLILIPQFFSVGAAITSVIAEFIISMIEIIYVVFIIRKIDIKMVFDGFYKCFFSGIIMFTIIFPMNLVLKSTMINSILLVGLGSFIYFMLLLVFRESLIIEVVKKVKNKFLRILKKNN